MNVALRFGNVIMWAGYLNALHSVYLELEISGTCLVMANSSGYLQTVRISS
jgi:hypothetical protein